ncbi:MAG: methyltransferase domain-containing protein [Clostridia bacterium]|nr:methyltransferase domain-containing protein [Clostridia bacterium]
MTNTDRLWVCPICREALCEGDTGFRCKNGHSFDKARQGYVNLLISSKGNKNHGDDKLMVKARKDFLDKGYYAPLREKVNEILGKGNVVLDAGCGEGYYTSLFAENNDVYGIDVSKDAVKYASSRCKNAAFAVASLSDIPLPDESVDVIINIFAPDFPDEILRVLKPNGRLIVVSPLENHLIELKNAIYDNPYPNSPQSPERNGFVLKSEHSLKFSIDIDNNEDLTSLFKMTPYYYKTSQQDQMKLQSLENITTKIEFFIAEYEKTDLTD